MSLYKLKISFLLTAFIMLAFAQTVSAQDGGLLHRPIEYNAQGRPAGRTLENSSFIFQPPIPPKGSELKVNTIITVLVDIRSLAKSEGDFESRRTSSLTATLAEWLKFDGKSLRPAPQSSGDLKIDGSSASTVRNEADSENRSSMTFEIAATIVEIRNNGNLVIEARQEVNNNDEKWRRYLIGIVNRDAIGPDYKVKSGNIANLRIVKEEVGDVRDGYKRGWLQKYYDKWKPF